MITIISLSLNHCPHQTAFCSSDLYILAAAAAKFSFFPLFPYTQALASVHANSFPPALLLLSCSYIIYLLHRSLANNFPFPFFYLLAITFTFTFALSFPLLPNFFDRCCRSLVIITISSFRRRRRRRRKRLPLMLLRFCPALILLVVRAVVFSSSSNGNCYLALAILLPLSSHLNFNFSYLFSWFSHIIWCYCV